MAVNLKLLESVEVKADNEDGKKGDRILTYALDNGETVRYKKEGGTGKEKFVSSSDPNFEP